jgi:plastocyanin
MLNYPLNRRFRVALAALLILATGCLAGWGSLLAAAPAPSELVINGFAFRPGTLTVARGTTVEWTNKDDEPHTVTSAGGPKLLKSPALDTGDSFTFTFNEPGIYKYFCSIHAQMQGTIVVQ